MELPPKIYNDGHFKGLPIYEETLFKIPKGSRTTLKADIEMWNENQHKMVSCLFRQHFTLVADIPVDAKHISLINVKVDRDQRGTVLRVDELSQCLVIPTLMAKDFYNLKETCVGLGALGIGAEFAGWTVQGVNDQQQSMCELQKKLGKGNVVQGDIAFGSTVGDLFRTFERPCPIALGFSCQAFSKGGDQLGGADSRSMSLPRALHAAYLMDAPLVVLECVSEAPSYAFVRNAIQQFCNATGFEKSEVILNLGDLWISQRKRWWCVLANAEIGKVPLSPLPCAKKPSVISDFCEELQTPNHNLLKEVQLKEHEYQQLINLGVAFQDCELNKHAQMPTALHSWGNQFQACQCGCRSTGLSMSRFSSRGFFGVLISMIDSDGRPFVRHPTPQEMALFCGLPIEMDFSGNPRLEMAAVGQLASPIHSGWIFSLIRVHLQQQQIKIGHVIHERQVIGNILQALFDMRRKVWPELQETIAMKMFEEAITQRFAVEESVKEENESSTQAEESAVSTPVIPVEKRKSEVRNETFGEKLAMIATRNIEQSQSKVGTGYIHGAIPGFTSSHEVVFETKAVQVVPESVESVETPEHTVSHPTPEPVFFRKEGFAVTPSDLLAKRTIVFNRIEDTIYAITVAPGTTVSQLIEVEGLDSKEIEVVTVIGNRLLGDAMIDHWQCVIIQKEEQRMSHLIPDRLQAELSKLPRYQSILLQGARVAFEEFAFYMSSFIRAEQAKVVSPIVVRELHDIGLLVESWVQEIKNHGNNLPIVTAVVTNDHWIPFVFRCKNDQWTARSPQEGCKLWELFGIDQIEIQIGPPLGKCFDNDCGFQAFAWLLVEVLGAQNTCIPVDQAALWRSLFWQSELTKSRVTQHSLVILGGHGDEVITAVASLLKEHGVFNERVIGRANEAIDAIGRNQIIQAMQGSRPWVALKQLANQKNPQFKLVWEDEFQAVLQARAKSGKPVGHKRNHKEKGSQRFAVQPDDLHVPPGVFVQEDGTPIHQIGVGQIGAVGNGLVVCTEKEVYPFLDTSQLTEAGLAFAIVDPSSSFVEQYGQPIRFPANCRKTGEPVLISAVLVQRGKQQVVRSVPQHPMKVQEVDVSTAKVLVYRDQVECDWEVFSESPIKYVLQQVQCLAACKKTNCSCKSWHPANDPGNEPLLDVWNRDFLTQAFRKSRASEAATFACAIRIRTDVFPQVMNASGNGGVYIEPRNDDGKGHSSNFHTVWLNKMTYDEAVAAKATARCCAYLIRVNRRYGLKTGIEHAETLHLQFRSEVPLLVEGKKEVYQVGPLPWGTTRSSLQKLFEQWQWAARPLQPVGRAADGKGLMWLAQATAQPGATAIAMAHGDVIIVKKGAEVVTAPKVPSVEASLHTKKSLGGVESLVHDPWAEAASQLPHVKRGEIGLTAQQIAQIESNLEKKIHESKSSGTDEDVTMAPSLEPRVKQLESQIAQIVDAQKSQQSQTIGLTSQVQGLQMQVERQSKEFQSHLDSKMESQMAKIEALLSKRMRQE